MSPTGAHTPFPADAGGRGFPRGFFALTAIKVVLTTAQRWVPALLPTLTAAFGATTTSMTSMMALGQLAGVATMFTGRWLNERTERRFIQFGIVVVAISSLVALGGTVASFGLSFVLLVVGHTHVTIASHAWIGHRVPYSRRGRAVGLFEVSWSLGLVVGTPLVAFAVARNGWQMGYLGLAIACGLALFLAGTRLPRDTGPTGVIITTASHRLAKLPRRAWLPIFASAFAATAGIGFFAIASTWLADSFGFDTRALSLIAFGYGAVELVAASSVAVISDRLGTSRAMLSGLIGLLVVIVVLGTAGQSVTIAVVALLGFLMLFEFAFVSSLALVTEAAPLQRGAAIGASNGVGTAGRAVGVALSGLLYEAVGISGALTMASMATIISILFLILDRRLTRAN